jgi:hypothetical protein
MNDARTARGGTVVNLALMEGDVRMFEGDLPYLLDMLRQVRGSVDNLRDTAVANGADPNAEPTARVLRAAHGATNSIAIAIEEGVRCCAIVRKHLESPQRAEPTAEVEEAWETLRAALSYARQELLRMGATF